MTHNPPKPPLEGFPIALQQSPEVSNTSSELENLRVGEDRFRVFLRLGQNTAT
jgi:hypothetical protein